MNSRVAVTILVASFVKCGGESTTVVERSPGAQRQTRVIQTDAGAAALSLAHRGADPPTNAWRARRIEETPSVRFNGCTVVNPFDSYSLLVNDSLFRSPRIRADAGVTFRSITSESFELHGFSAEQPKSTKLLGHDRSWKEVGGAWSRYWQ